MQNMICLIALIAIAALLTWWGFRGWRVRNSFLKWGRLGLAAVLTVTVSSVSALLIAGMLEQHARSERHERIGHVIGRDQCADVISAPCGSKLLLHHAGRRPHGILIEVEDRA